uniref:CSON007986 protein n=1 Tax=Culicoides sonorensis TaxID=179676 RepID=A0A336LYC8_CULSO
MHFVLHFASSRHRCGRTHNFLSYLVLTYCFSGRFSACHAISSRESLFISKLLHNSESPEVNFNPNLVENSQKLVDRRKFRFNALRDELNDGVSIDSHLRSSRRRRPIWVKIQTDINYFYFKLF